MSPLPSGLGFSRTRLPLLLASLLLLVSLPACDKTADDSSLPPVERVARFDNFAKEGMDWSELAAKFPPSRYQFGLTDPNDPNTRIGGTYYKDWTDAQEFRQSLADTPNQAGFTFQYNWSREPLVYYDVSFTREGALRYIARRGNFTDPQ